MEQEVIRPTTGDGIVAVEVARRYYNESLFNHCARSYLLAREDAKRNSLQFDDELLLVSAMLHDLALTDPFDSTTVPFEEAGGQVAWIFAAAAGWSLQRRNRVADVIERHMWDSVPAEVDTEGFLLERATSLDISGRNKEDWPAEFLAEVVAAYPRHDLTDVFASCRKPQSRAAQAVATGIRERLRANPLNSF
jgi:HD superfamily phosphodiesterase